MEQETTGATFLSSPDPLPGRPGHAGAAPPRWTPALTPSPLSICRRLPTRPTPWSDLTDDHRALSAGGPQHGTGQVHIPFQQEVIKYAATGFSHTAAPVPPAAIGPERPYQLSPSPNPHQPQGHNTMQTYPEMFPPDRRNDPIPPVGREHYSRMEITAASSITIQHVDTLIVNTVPAHPPPITGMEEDETAEE